MDPRNRRSDHAFRGAHPGVVVAVPHEGPLTEGPWDVSGDEEMNHTDDEERVAHEGDVPLDVPTAAKWVAHEARLWTMFPVAGWRGAGPPEHTLPLPARLAWEALDRAYSSPEVPEARAAAIKERAREYISAHEQGAPPGDERVQDTRVFLLLEVHTLLRDEACPQHIRWAAVAAVPCLFVCITDEDSTDLRGWNALTDTCRQPWLDDETRRFLADVEEGLIQPWKQHHERDFLREFRRVLRLSECPDAGSSMEQKPRRKGHAGIAQQDAAGNKVAHSEDFTSVCWFGTTHHFTKSQAQCIRLLWEEWGF